jgi:DNA-directed RNA polymerase specialized sigma24 family protein
VPEIAEALGIKLNTVYSRLRLGRRQFERALAQHRLGQETRREP